VPLGDRAWTPDTTRVPVEPPHLVAGLLLLLLVGRYVLVHLDNSGRPEEDGEAPRLREAPGGRPRNPLRTRARGRWTAPPTSCSWSSWAVVPAVFLAVGPGLRHLAAAYPTSPLASRRRSRGCLLAAWRMWRMAALASALSALVMGLARPGRGLGSRRERPGRHFEARRIWRRFGGSDATRVRSLRRWTRRPAPSWPLDADRSGRHRVSPSSPRARRLAAAV
jgi:hypothetical protein